MNPSRIDPITFLLCRDGHYWVEAHRDFPIDPRTLATGGNTERRRREEPMQPLPGILGERVAERPHGKPKHASY